MQSCTVMCARGEEELWTVREEIETGWTHTNT